MKYRQEIDGLRSIAVASVLMFHFFPAFMPLGYLGVDLFFVISGFLISAYILEQAQNGTLRFRTFYWRRIKRILPVTLFVLLTCSIFAVLFLTPPDLVRYAHSLFSTLTFSANFFFWSTGGYFGAANDLKPLLHMWSLGVEEQFYLVFPLVFSLILAVFRRNYLVMTITILIVTVSFSLNIYLLQIGGSAPAFFLLPTRVWQFGIGVIAALVHLNQRANYWPIMTPILLLFLAYDLNFRVGWVPQATISTLALGVFLAGSHAPSTVSMNVLTSSVVRRIGLISFSLYLWHWPIISFLKYYYIGKVPNFSLLTGLVATFIFASTSYALIEQPFRHKIGGRFVSTFVISSMVILSVFGLVAVQSNGLRAWSSRLVNTIASATQTNYHCPKAAFFRYGNSRACYINKSTTTDYSIALVGNSYAQMYAPALDVLLSANNRKAVLIALNSCPPTIDLNISTKCLRLARNNFNTYVKDKNIKKVIFATSWFHRRFVAEDGTIRKDPDKTILAHSLLRLIEKVERSGKEVFLIGPIQTPMQNLASKLSRELLFGKVNEAGAIGQLRVNRGEFDRDYAKTIQILSAHLQTNFLLPHPLLCDDEFCNFGNANAMYFADAIHLSHRGSVLMSPIFEPVFKE